MIHFAIALAIARLTAAQDAPDTRDFLTHEFFLPYESGLWWPTKTYVKEVQFNPASKQCVEWGVLQSVPIYACWPQATHPCPDFILLSKDSTALVISARTMEIPQPTNITFACGNHGSIEINLKTGAVKLTNVTMDESGVLFWAGVIKAFPGVREIIRASP